MAATAGEENDPVRFLLSRDQPGPGDCKRWARERLSYSLTEPPEGREDRHVVEVPLRPGEGTDAAPGRPIASSVMSSFRRR